MIELDFNADLMQKKACQVIGNIHDDKDIKLGRTFTAEGRR